MPRPANKYREDRVERESRSGSHRGNAGEESLVRAAYDLLEDVKKARNVGVYVSFTPVPRRGVFELAFFAYDNQRPMTEGPRWSYTCEWPSVVAATFAAGLYRGVVMVTRMVEEGRAAENGGDTHERDLGRK